MTKAIIFDFDGVIEDTFHIAYKVNKAQYAGLTEEKYRDFFDGNIYENKEVTPERTKQFFDMQEELYRDLKIERAIYDELLKLKDRYKLFIITSNREPVINRYFEDNNLTGVFEKVLGMETHKSKEVKFGMILSKSGLLKEECVFVTDTLGDLIEANKVGIRTIAVTFGYHDEKRLARGNPAVLVSDFKEISQNL